MSLVLSTVVEGAWKKQREQSFIVCKEVKGARKRRVSYEYVSGPSEGRGGVIGGGKAADPSGKAYIHLCCVCRPQALPYTLHV